LTLNTLLLAFALMLVVEGLGPLLFPNRWRAYMLRLAGEQANVIRQIGLMLVISGLLLIFIFS
jgi:uncharacterized protein YjeT (DUF2065 family)